LGTVLVNSAGRTLYAFSADSPSAIVCGASCTPIWPPLTVPSSTTPTAGSGVTGQLGTVTRADGSHQVTYNGLLLYTYTGDSGSGQTKGQGIVEQYGATKGTWTVVTPSSKAASVAPTTTAPPPASTTTAPKPAAPTAPGAATTAPAPTTTAPAPTTTAPAPTTTAGGTWA
jgi:predicted lipoprotein with Yx(FWY)xxD motif